MVVHTRIPAPGRPKQKVDVYEFEACLVYMSSRQLVLHKETLSKNKQKTVLSQNFT